MPWLTEDAERLKRFRAGDPAVLAEVYSMYSRDLADLFAQRVSLPVDGKTFRFAGVSQPFDLDDLVQETFIRAFTESARNAYDGLRPYRNYLATIARNLLIDRFRRARRIAALFTELESETQVGEYAESPEQRVQRGQLRKLYDDFMDSLDEPNRVLVRLRFEEDEPRRAVVEQTGMSEMQVRTRETRLRDRLFELLRSFSAALLLLMWPGGGA